jgi:hypothetical protein
MYRAVAMLLLYMLEQIITRTILYRLLLDETFEVQSFLESLKKAYKN